MYVMQASLEHPFEREWPVGVRLVRTAESETDCFPAGLPGERSALGHVHDDRDR